MPYITCHQKRNQNKVNVSVCENCMGMECPDYHRYVQLSLFPGQRSHERGRPKFRPDTGPDKDRTDSNAHKQLSWLNNQDVISPRP